MSLLDRRIAKGWTQEQLAEHAGLSVRTIQRVEGGHAASLETLKCLAAVFETTVRTLVEEQAMSTIGAQAPNENDAREAEAIRYVENLKGFCVHALLFVLIITGLAVLNAVISPGQWWVLLVAVSWASALAIHAAILFGVGVWFGPAWEQRQFRKRMGR